jgi:hypothetical protein
MYSLDVGWDSGNRHLWDNFRREIIPGYHLSTISLDDYLAEFDAVDVPKTTYIDFKTQEAMTFFILRFS